MRAPLGYEGCSEYARMSLIPWLGFICTTTGTLILSRTVAQFHPAAIHFVSIQMQLPDSCDQAASRSLKRLR